MLAKRSPLEKVREAAEARAYDDALWAEIRGLGWPGIAIPEEHGGQGLGTVELAILCEELGYACAPTPFLSNASAGLFIDQAGSDEQRQRWLPGIASGEERGAAAFEPRSNELVPDAAGAAVLVLNDGDGAVLVEAGDAEIEPVELVDATRLVRAGIGLRRRSAAGRRRGRRGPLAGRARRRADRDRPAGDGDGDRLREGAPAVRPPDRRLPGRLAPLRRDALRRRGGALAHLLRGLVRRRRAGVAAAGELDGQGPGLRRRLAGDQRRAPGARRHRLHLGARPPLPAQAGQGRRRAARRPPHAPRARRHARRPGRSRRRRPERAPVVSPAGSRRRRRA